MALAKILSKNFEENTKSLTNAQRVSSPLCSKPVRGCIDYWENVIKIVII